MMSHDFAALVSLKQGFTNPPLKDLIMLPVSSTLQFIRLIFQISPVYAIVL